MTREERKLRNKRAHAIRRECTDADYREAKRAGQSITWREIWDTYAAIDAALVVETLAAEPLPARKPKRPAPAHVARVAEEYRLARESWEAGLAEAVAGGRTRANGGKPARGERFTDEERDYRAAHPAPVYKDFLVQSARVSVSA